MALLKSRDYYKPFEYGWAYRAYKTMRAIAWEPHEAPMQDDVKDWPRLKPTERSLLEQIFRFFTQADVDIARGYRSKYMPRFEHPELQMMFAAFVDSEANHIDAYSTLLETLGLPEEEFKLFMDYKSMRDKHEYMFEKTQGHSISDLAVDLAVFSAFGEGMQLFSSFAILLSFQRRGLMKGMTTIVEWSIRDESHHVESMIKLFHELIKEHPRIWNDETKKRIYDVCREMVKLEDAFIDQAFSAGEVEGITKEDTKRYIRYIADRRLLQLGLKPNYRVKENPLPWLDWIMNAPTHTNFFEGRSTEYGKGLTEGWDRAYNGLHLLRKLRVYTKPDCPWCSRAKDLLNQQFVPFETIELTEAEDRQAKFVEIGERYNREWKTSPMIFVLDDQGNEQEFIGGYDDLTKYLS